MAPPLPPVLTGFVDHPIAFHRKFAAIAGSAAGGLWLSQAVYWQERCTREDGKWWKTAQDWSAETALTRSEQERARRTLKRLGVLEEELRGLPARTWYRIDFDILASLLASTQPMPPQAAAQAAPPIGSKDDDTAEVVERIAELLAAGKGPAAGKEAAYLRAALGRRVSASEAARLMKVAHEHAAGLADAQTSAHAAAKQRAAKHLAALEARSRAAALRDPLSR